MSTKLFGIWDKAVLVGSNNQNDYRYTVTINPFFNYIAEKYGERDELNMPNGYVEAERLNRSDADSVESDFPDTINNFVEVFEPVKDSVTKRIGFTNNSFNDRSQQGISRMKQVFYFDNVIMNQNDMFRMSKGTDEISGHFPQAVKIEFNTKVTPSQSNGMLKKLLADYGQANLKGMFPFFVKSLIERHSSEDMTFTGMPDGVKSKTYRYNQINSITSENLFYDSFISAYDQPSNSCCPLTSLLRPENDEGAERWTGEELKTHLKTSEANPFTNGVGGVVEDLFFEIRKLDSDNNIIQTFYTSFLSEEASVWSFYDTQVKPEKEYIYQIISWRFHSGDTVGHFISQSPVPIFSKAIKITQPSLPVPDVSFQTYKDEINKYKIKILLNLNKNSEDGKFYPSGFKEFVPMVSSDSLYNETLQEWQNRRDMFDIMSSKKNFVYESQRGSFEIYKMSSQPEVGYDNISVPPILRQAYVGTQLCYIDELEPFKKYYYVFRAINTYGYPSNPTEIYEVELYQDADEFFLNMQTVDFANLKKDKYKTFKSMMKMLQIIPSTNQTIFNKNNLEQATTDTTEAITTIVNGVMYNAVGYKNADGSYTRTGYYEGEYNQDSVIYFDETPDEYKNSISSIPLFTGGVEEILGLSPYLDQNTELPTLGMSDKKIWTVLDDNGQNKEIGEKFKIRIVSNDTGRKLDLNVRFLLKKN